jgi:hypothetical protein
MLGYLKPGGPTDDSGPGLRRPGGRRRSPENPKSLHSRGEVCSPKAILRRPRWLVYQVKYSEAQKFNLMPGAIRTQVLLTDSSAFNPMDGDAPGVLTIGWDHGAGNIWFNATHDKDLWRRTTQKEAICT